MNNVLTAGDNVTTKYESTWYETRIESAARVGGIRFYTILDIMIIWRVRTQ